MNNKYAIEVGLNGGFLGFFNKYNLGQERREQVFYDFDNPEIKQEIYERMLDAVKSFPAQKVSFAFIEEPEAKEEQDDFEESFDEDDD